MSARVDTRTFDTLIAQYPPGVQALAVEARSFLRDLLPDAEEVIDRSAPYAFYCFGPGYRGIVCNLSVSKTGVKIGLAGGGALADPRRLMRGSGKVHRHVPIESVSDLRTPGLKALVRAAHAAWRKRSAEGV